MSEKNTNTRQDSVKPAKLERKPNNQNIASESIKPPDIEKIPSKPPKK